VWKLHGDKAAIVFEPLVLSGTTYSPVTGDDHVAGAGENKERWLATAPLNATLPLS